MGAVKSAGIKTLTLDVTSAESIKQCVENICSSTGGTLDVLVNNAGRDYMMPMLDIKLDGMARLFDANFVSIIAMSQAFFPLLRKSNKRPIIVNNTSVNSIQGGHQFNSINFAFAWRCVDSLPSIWPVELNRRISKLS